MLKRFAIVLWILVATNWYTSANTSGNKPGISLSPISSDLPPFASKNNCYHLEKLQKTGLYFGAVIEIGLHEDINYHNNSLIASNKHIFSEANNYTFQKIRSINFPLFTDFSFPKTAHFNQSITNNKGTLQGFCSNVFISIPDASAYYPPKHLLSKNFQLGLPPDRAYKNFIPGRIVIKFNPTNEANEDQSFFLSKDFKQIFRKVQLRNAHLYFMN